MPSFVTDWHFMFLDGWAVEKELQVVDPRGALTRAVRVARTGL
jgi:hypothetical protein